MAPATLCAERRPRSPDCLLRIHGLGDPPPSLRDHHPAQGAAALRGALRRGRRAGDLLRGRPRRSRTNPRRRSCCGGWPGRATRSATTRYTHPYDLSAARPSRSPRRRFGAPTRCSPRWRRPARAGRLPRARLQPERQGPPRRSPTAATATTRRCSRRRPTTWPRRRSWAGWCCAGRRSGAVVADPRTLLAPRIPTGPTPSALASRRLAARRAAGRGASRARASRPSAPSSPPARSGCAGSCCAAWPGRPFFNLELHGIDLADADRRPHPDRAGRAPARPARALRREAPPFSDHRRRAQAELPLRHPARGRGRAAARRGALSQRLDSRQGILTNTLPLRARRSLARSIEMATLSPLQQVTEKHGGKEKLVDKLLGVARPRRGSRRTSCAPGC